MQAIILAGGKGTRLKPYTTVFPKPLMPIGDYPILEVVIKQLKHYEFNEITMAVGHLRELIQAFFNNGQKWGVNIAYSVEDKPLGTAGPLNLIENLDDNFLMMNGDILTNMNYQAFFRQHLDSGAICSIATYKKSVKIDLGILETNKLNELTSYIEKPNLDYTVSMGIYAFRRNILNFIPDNSYLDLPELVKKLLEMRERVIAYRFDGFWLDIGRPDDYEVAIQQFDDHKMEFIKE